MSDTNWEITDAFLREKSLVAPQIDTYNYFIENELQEIVTEFGHLTYRGPTHDHYIRYGNIYVTLPKNFELMGQIDMTPYEARIRGLTYSCNVYVDLYSGKRTHEETERGLSYEEDEITRVMLCRIPMMVKSKYCNLYGLSDRELSLRKECPTDPGGYFIINGTEKVVIAQERMASNMLYIFEKNTQKVSHITEVHSSADATSTKMTILKLLTKTKSYHLTVPIAKQDVPLLVVYVALGWSIEKAIQDISMGDQEIAHLLGPSISEIPNLKTREEALVYLCNKIQVPGTSLIQKCETALRILMTDLLPHCGPDVDKKLEYLSYMTRRTSNVVLGKSLPDDRDHTGKKRVDFTGTLMSSLFRMLFKHMIKNDLAMGFKKKIDNGDPFSLPDFVKQYSLKLFNGLRYALGTGNWGDQKKTFTYTRVGVSQPLNRYNYSATVSHLRRINTPVGREGKLVKPRLLHLSQWGIVCPSETPEGQSCGLIKNLALTAMSSEKSSRIDIEKRLVFHGISEKRTDMTRCPVFVNGTLMGYTDNPSRLQQLLRQDRRKQLIHQHVSISVNQGAEVLVQTDHGRMLRPLLVVQDGKVLASDMSAPVGTTLSWHDYIINGVVEYIDSLEAENCLVAVRQDEVTEDHTHCEIHPSLILGVCASTIPFSDHNQAPRNTYQSAMTKQAMGLFIGNYADRMDTSFHVLHYPQRPLVSTHVSEYLQGNQLPAGENAIVAIMCYGGYNQEDSLIFNQSAIDRGLFRSSSYYTHTEVERGKSGQISETIERPANEDPEILKRLDADGIASPGTRFKMDDIVVWKTNNTDKRRDVSMRIKNMTSGIIDKVLVTRNDDNYVTVKMRARQERVPEVGDKFASRHGQKGIMGITYRQEDMPFTSEGIVPDLIVNPHAIPSRMTIGHLIECILGKSAVMTGKLGDATPFDKEFSVDGLMETLEKFGYKGDGTEVMYSGITGERLTARVFIGPTFYQRLKHMVHDKMHARSTGPLQVLTRQPVEGRSREGGLRVGELERDGMLAHGSAMFLRDRLFQCSDKYTLPVCTECGLSAIAESISHADESAKQYRCSACKESQVEVVEMPYANNLFFKELMSMGIAPRVRVKQ